MDHYRQDQKKIKMACPHFSKKRNKQILQYLHSNFNKFARGGYQFADNR